MKTIRAIINKFAKLFRKKTKLKPKKNLEEIEITATGFVPSDDSQFVRFRKGVTEKKSK